MKNTSYSLNAISKALLETYFCSFFLSKLKQLPTYFTILTFSHLLFVVDLQASLKDVANNYFIVYSKGQIHLLRLLGFFLFYFQHNPI